MHHLGTLSPHYMLVLVLPFLLGLLEKSGDLQEISELIYGTCVPAATDDFFPLLTSFLALPLPPSAAPFLRSSSCCGLPLFWGCDNYNMTLFIKY